MNAWNAHIAMIANKQKAVLFLTAVLFGFIVNAPFARAEEVETAPAMFGIKELQIQHPRTPNAEATASCGASSGEIATMVIKAFKTEGMPAFFVLNAPKLNPEVARIDIFPDIVTTQPHEKECVSWIALTAQGRAALFIEPIKVPRNMSVTYWQGGLMISTTQITHTTSINEAISSLVAEFARQYRVDQPPNLTPPKE